MTALALCLVDAAFAWSGLEASSAIIEVPTVDTQAATQVSWSFAVAGRRGARGFEADLLPLAAAFGYSRRLELGVVVDRNPDVEASHNAAEVVVRTRARLVDPVRFRPGLALEGAVGAVPGDTLADLRLVASTDGRVTLTTTAGVKLTARRTYLASFGAGFEARIDGKGAWMVEVSGVANAAGVDTLTVRGGARARLRPRITLLTWAGGGRERGSPWLGAGIALGLSSVDVNKVDFDVDKVIDWSDNCRYLPEDLDGFEDGDGCPDEDNDGDGILDVDDETPDGGVAAPPIDPLAGDVPLLKIRIQQRKVPGPLDPAFRQLAPPPPPPPTPPPVEPPPVEPPPGNP